MLIYFWVVLVISPAGFLEDLLGCSAICIINDSYHIVSILKCMCSQNKVIHSCQLHSLKFNFSIICIQKSWLREQDEMSQIQLEDYNCIAQGKSSSAKGGLIMYIHTKYDYKLIKINQYENWEGQLIEITGGGLTKPVIMGHIYIPQRDLNVNYKQFIDEFSLLLSTFDQSNSEVIIAGDFNINLRKINQKEIFNDFFYSLTEHSFFPKITLPTRFSNLNGTLIDNISCKLSQPTLNSTSGILIKQFSNHQPYFIFIDNLTNALQNL